MAPDRHEPATEADDEMDTVARLIRTAGRRMDPPSAAFEQTLARATEAWRAKVQRRSQRQRFVAIAASLLIVIGVALLVTNRPPPPESIAARADRLVGTVEIRSAASGEWVTLRDETMSLVVGTQLRTLAGSRAGIVLNSGTSVRLADATSLVLASAASVRLVTGKVYLDTGSSSHDSQQVEVITPVGTARDIGTQFEVLYRNDAYRLRVRDGQVLLHHHAGQADGSAGEQLTIDARGELERTRVTRGDPDWQWVESVAPAPEIDDRPLTVLLEWVARETGRVIQFDKPEIERKAGTTILHGNIRHLAPLEALTVMLATTDLEYALPDDGTILIRLKATR